jgi:hypothetical protein
MSNNAELQELNLKIQEVSKQLEALQELKRIKLAEIHAKENELRKKPIVIFTKLNIAESFGEKSFDKRFTEVAENNAKSDDDNGREIVDYIVDGSVFGEGWKVKTSTISRNYMDTMIECIVEYDCVETANKVVDFFSKLTEIDYVNKVKPIAEPSLYTIKEYRDLKTRLIQSYGKEKVDEMEQRYSETIEEISDSGYAYKSNARCIICINGSKYVTHDFVSTCCPHDGDCYYKLCQRVYKQLNMKLPLFLYCDGNCDK